MLKRHNSPQLRCVFVSLNLLLIACLILHVLCFFVEWFIRAPYDTTSVNYYLNEVKIESSGKFVASTNYENCGEQTQDQDCNTIINLNKTSVALISINISFISIIIITISYYLYRKYHTLMTLQVICFLFVIQYAILIYVFVNYMNKFPYAVFCDYDIEQQCSFDQAINIIIYASTILIVCATLLFSVLITYNYTINDNKEIYNKLSEEGANETTINSNLINNNNNNNNNSNNSNNNRKHYSLTSKICCSVCMGILNLIIIGIALSTSSVYQDLIPLDLTNSANDDNLWSNATCINENGYFTTPQTYSDPTPCTFEAPFSLDDILDSEYWTCCESNTCNIAYDYSTLLSNYNSTNDPCYIDMLALNKVSCHPLDRWFIDLPYHINEKAQNNVYICNVFCYEIYEHCQNNYINGINSSTSTVKEYYDGSAINFCEQGLGMNVRDAYFTNECYDDGNQCSLHNIIKIIIFIMVIIIM